MYGYIYKTTCLVNNKIYIGQKKSTTFLGRKYFGSGKILKLALSKYGKENFKVELLKECSSFEELNYSERYFIELFNSTNEDIGYNITLGGQGTCGVDPGYHDGMRGKHQSDYQKQRAKETLLNREWTPEIRKNMSVGQTGKIIPATRKKCRCIETGEVFDCLTDACKFAKSRHVADVCYGLRRKAGGYTWEFI